MSRTFVRRFGLAVAPPFELELALFGHGWIDLAPHVWDVKAQTWHTVLSIHDGARVRAVDVAVLQRGRKLAVDLTSARSIKANEVATLRAALTRMLRLDHDYGPFWRRCAALPALQWVARRGGGRLLAGATLFEDLMKLLFTTNCSWAATRLMATRLVDALGTKAPSGRGAFPSPLACAGERETFWRNVVKAGYRARACRELAHRFASGELADEQFTDPKLATSEVRRRLLALHGFGPYAAGQALRLLGRHDDLALDSWCRTRLAALHGRRRPPTDRSIERRYAGYGCDRGLVLWMELTAEWHGEGATAANRA